MNMHQILIRLSNVVAWLNFLIGLCAGLALSYFSLTFLLNGSNEPLTYDATNQKIVNELNSDGVYSQSSMSLKSPDDMASMMALRLRLDVEERAIAVSKLPKCYENFPELLDPNFSKSETIAGVLFPCWEQKSKAERPPLTFDFTPKQASEAWNNIARHKLAQEERNKKRKLQNTARDGLVVSALAVIPYILLALLSYIFSGSFRLIPWVPIHKSS